MPRSPKRSAFFLQVFQTWANILLFVLTRKIEPYPKIMKSRLGMLEVLVIFPTFRRYFTVGESKAAKLLNVLIDNNTSPDFQPFAIGD